MTDKLVLKLNDQVVEIEQDDNGRYCLNDLYKVSGGDDSKKPSKWLRYQKDLEVINLESGLKVLIPDDFDSYIIKVGKARATKTFGSRKTVLKYAMFIDKDFYESVVTAFDKLVTGDVQEAANIASSVTITPEIINKHDQLRKKLQQTIQEVYGTKKHWFSNYFRLIAKTVTGFTPKELTGGFDSTTDYITKEGHLPAMNAMIECERMILTLLKAGVTDYHIIAATLGVSTAKNKELLKQVELEETN